MTVLPTVTGTRMRIRTIHKSCKSKSLIFSCGMTYMQLCEACEHAGRCAMWTKQNGHGHGILKRFMSKEFFY